MSTENQVIFPKFNQKKQYSPEFLATIQKTVDDLCNHTSKVTKPGLLLGKIQSGKTNTYIGIIAMAFDKGYGNCVIFTKGTKALTEQTKQRLRSDFKEFISSDIIRLYDIMKLPPKFTKYVRQKKLIFIVKKQKQNLDKLANLFNKFPDLIQKRTLMIDDEADLVSIGFSKKSNGISMNVLASKINDFRTEFSNNYDFLQVTATPQSLYLQPREPLEINGYEVKPMKPAFTQLVPVHTVYIGGKEYFELSKDPNSIFSHLYIQVPDTELKTLNKRHERYITTVLTTSNLEVFRQAIINYLVSGAIRIIQNEQENKLYKSCFIIHTATTKDRHQWQVELTEALLYDLTKLAKCNIEMLDNLIIKGYENISLSIKKNNDIPPPFMEVAKRIREALIQDAIGIVKINSENEVSALLDDKGQLQLDNPFNIFIGGQILDRGLTIENFIGFFYGRNPNTFQQDTVLQHSRMYGARPMKDMVVTRYYTSNRIYRNLTKIHEYDSALRDAFERGIYSNDDGVVFLERDKTGAIRYCAPHKILNSSIEILKPYGRYLPIGFQTKAKTQIQKTITEIDNIIEKESKGDLSEPFLIQLETAIYLLDRIESTFEYSKDIENIDYVWDKKTHIAIIRRLVNNIQDQKLKGQLYCYAQKNRNISRLKNNDTAFTDAPDDGKTDIPKAKSVAIDTPCLIMLRQNGLQEQKWRGSAFWWPVLFAPKNTKTAVFASESIN